MSSAISALSVIGVAIFMSILMAKGRTAQTQIDTLSGSLVFRHTWILKALGLGSLIFSAALCLIAAVAKSFLVDEREKDQVGLSLGIFLVFAVLASLLTWEALKFAIIASKDGLDCRSPWRRRRWVDWHEIVEVAFSQSSGFIIRTTDGWKFRVPSYIAGISQFLEECEPSLAQVSP